MKSCLRTQIKQQQQRLLKSIKSSTTRRYLNTTNTKSSSQYSSKFLASSLAIAGLTVAASLTVLNTQDSIKNDSTITITTSDENSAFQKIISPQELSKHNKVEDCWIAIDGKVYDVTSFLETHPGGVARIIKYAGTDATKAFQKQHNLELIMRQLSPNDYIGDIPELKPVVKTRKPKHHHRSRVIVVDEEDDEEEEEFTAEELEEFARQERIANKPPLNAIFNISDFETVAKAVLPSSTWGYYSTGSNDEFSLRENHYAFGRIFFRPKILVDTSACTTKSTFLGQDVDAPFYITAFAGSSMADPNAELNLLKPAARENIVHLVPTQCSYPVKEFVKHAEPEQTNFYQLHFYSRSEIDNLADTFKKVESEMPTMKGYFINVDLATIGNREKDAKFRALDPSMLEELSKIVTNSQDYAPITWEDFKEIRKLTKLPIVLKGVQRKEDVLKAAEIGLNGCLLSNHGGRQLDFSMPPIEVLAQSKKLLKEKNLDKGFELFIDGGVRRGSDIIKAICLGASGVGLGRPFLYAMSGYGEQGVERAIKILKTEMLRDMKLLGVNSISELNEDMVDISSLQFKGLNSDDRLYNVNYSEMPKVAFSSPAK